MLYDTYSIGGVLYHADRANHKYIKKVKTKNGKWRYYYNKMKDSNWDESISNMYKDFYNIAARNTDKLRKFSDQGHKKYVKNLNNSYNKILNNNQRDYQENVNDTKREINGNIKEYGEKTGNFLNEPLNEYLKNIRKQNNDFIKQVTDQRKQAIINENKMYRDSNKKLTKDYNEEIGKVKASRNEAKLNRRDSEYYRRQAVTAIGDKKYKKKIKRYEKMLEILNKLQRK